MTEEEKILLFEDFLEEIEKKQDRVFEFCRDKIELRKYQLLSKKSKKVDSHLKQSIEDLSDSEDIYAQVDDINQNLPDALVYINEFMNFFNGNEDTDEVNDTSILYFFYKKHADKALLEEFEEHLTFRDSLEAYYERQEAKDVLAKIQSGSQLKSGFSFTRTQLMRVAAGIAILLVVGSGFYIYNKSNLNSNINVLVDKEDSIFNQNGEDDFLLIDSANSISYASDNKRKARLMLDSLENLMKHENQEFKKELRNKIDSLKQLLESPKKSIQIE